MEFGQPHLNMCFNINVGFYYYSDIRSFWYMDFKILSTTVSWCSRE